MPGFFSGMRLRVSERTFCYPDLMVVSGEDPHPERPCLEMRLPLGALYGGVGLA